MARPQKHEIAVLEPSTAAAATIAYGSPDFAAQLRRIVGDLGFAIVTGVADAAQCRALAAAFGEDLKDLLSVPADPTPSIADAYARVGPSADAEDRPRQWPHGTRLGPPSSGFASDLGLPQGRFAWTARLHPPIRAVYAALHECAESALCVGADLPFFTPGTCPPAEQTSLLWPHADQNKHISASGAWDVWQSLLYVWSSEDTGASTTVVWPRSHLTPYETLMADPGVATLGAHYCEVRAMSDRLVSGSLRDTFVRDARRVPVPAGALLVWNSRLIHQGHAGGPRLAMPVCWEPRNRRDAATLKRKIRLCAMGLATTHWASLGEKHDLLFQLALTRTARNAETWQGVGLPLEARPTKLFCFDPDSVRSAGTAESPGPEELPLRREILEAL